MCAYIHIIYYISFKKLHSKLTNLNITNTSSDIGHYLSHNQSYTLISLSISDPKIAKALIQMLSMGFSNEEGTLIRLLEEKDGDIDQVIGILDQNEEKTIEFD